jgi:hypothetical protein
MSRPPTADEPARILERAKRYPYEAPRSSFVLAAGRYYDVLEPRPLEDLSRVPFRDVASDRELAFGELLGPDASEAAGRARRGVLAYGANRAPQALKRKRALPGFPPDDAIVVLRARLHGFDVVYSAHLSPYGAVGATLQASPGTAVEVWLTLLTHAQLAALGETEPNYTLEQLDRLELEVDGGERPDRAQSYVSRHGSLVLEGQETALAAIPAEGRSLPARTEPDVLAAVAARLGHGGSVDEFILESVADPERSAARTRELRRDARPLDWPHRRGLSPESPGGPLEQSRP